MATPNFNKLLKSLKSKERKQFDGEKNKKEEKKQFDGEQKEIKLFNKKQYTALEILNKNLPEWTADSLGKFPVHSFVEELLKILKQQFIAENEPNLWYVASAVLIKICDMFPSSYAAVVDCDGVTVIADIYTTTDENLAKQYLQALEAISEVHPIVCLEAGALSKVLNCRHSAHFKRVALFTASNMCKKLTIDTAEFGTIVVPLLTEYLEDLDTKVVELSSICLTKIVEALALSPNRLDEVLRKHGFINRAAALISCGNCGGGQASLNTSAYRALVLLLSTCASNSNLGSELLLDHGIIGILKDILTGSGISPALSRPQEQIVEIVNLANVFLPPVISEEQDDSIATEVIAHEKLLKERPKLLEQFIIDLLPVLIQICESRLNGPVPRKCLSVIAKLMHFSSACMIKSVLSATNISSFLAGVLSRKDPQVLISALQITDTLMKKLPEIVSKIFVREGVLQAVDTLIIRGSPGITFPQPSSCEDESFKHSGLAVGSPPKPIEVPASTLCAKVISSAQDFKDRYSQYSPEFVGTRSQELLHLKSLCLKLIEGSQIGEDMATSILSEILKVLSKGDGVSTFEFIDSGVVGAFLNYLSCGSYFKENISEFSVSMYREQATRRCKTLLTVARSFGLQDNKVAPMNILVRNLQNALSSLECFPVVLSHGAKSSSINGYRSSGLSVLSQACYLRLCRAKGDESLIDYSSYVFKFHPLATFVAVEEFLWPHVQQDESIQPSALAEKSEIGIMPTGAREELAQENNGILSKRKEKAVLTQKDDCGTHMIIDARRGSDVYKGAQMKTDEELNDDISDKDDQDDVCGGFSTTGEWREKLVASPRLTFFAGGKQLSRSISVYQAIQQFLLDKVVNDNDGSRVLGDIYTFTYQRASSTTNKVLVETIGCMDPSESREVMSHVDSSKQKMSILDSILRGEVPCDLEKSDPTCNILALLRLLEGLNKPSSNLHGNAFTDRSSEGKMSSLYDLSEIDGIVPDEEFINNQLTSKLIGQVKDALALRSESPPSWCCQLMKECPFLFPFKMRHQYFYLTVFPFSRALYNRQALYHRQALYRRQQKQGADGHASTKKKSSRFGRMRHHKVRVSRDSILDSVAQFMEMDSDQKKYVLEVDFFGEVDTGLEPTLEFYNLAILELLKVEPEMWRSYYASDKSMTCGLFPRSWPKDADFSDGSTLKRVVSYFKLLGFVLAKALQDKRPLDLPLSLAFYKLLLGQDLNLHDIISFDPELGNKLLRYQALVDGKLYPRSRGGNNEVTEIRFSENENANEDPAHDFTLPGFSYPENVYINNLEEYIVFVFDVTAKSGIERQLEALKAGFDEVFDISSLQIFSAKELENMICNRI